MDSSHCGEREPLCMPFSQLDLASCSLPLTAVKPPPHLIRSQRWLSKLHNYITDRSLKPRGHASGACQPPSVFLSRSMPMLSIHILAQLPYKSSAMNELNFMFILKFALFAISVPGRIPGVSPSMSHLILRTNSFDSHYGCCSVDLKIGAPTCGSILASDQCAHSPR